jgi:two-component system, NarL family, invasion response regulator UvrY
MIRVLIADDHQIFREGLVCLLTAAGGIVVAAEAADGAEALEHLRNGEFDVAVLDINMPHRNGLEVLACARKRWPQLAVLMLSAYPEEQYAMEAFRAGALGYVTKGVGVQELAAAIRKVAAGGRYASCGLAAKLIDLQDAAASGAPLHHRLSARESRTLDLIVAGQSLTGIAEQLHVSVSTVSTYRARVLEKLEVRNNAELVAYAIKHQLRH